MQKFNELRPNDINLELAISNNSKRLVYYQFNELVSFLDQLGYEIYAKTVNTLFFLDTKNK